MKVYVLAQEGDVDEPVVIAAFTSHEGAANYISNHPGPKVYGDPGDYWIIEVEVDPK